MDGLPHLTRLQAEAAALAVSILALLWLYRTYLDRSLVLQREYLDGLTGERDRDRAVRNGSLDAVKVAEWLRAHPEHWPLMPDGPRDVTRPPAEPGVGDA